MRKHVRKAAVAVKDAMSIGKIVSGGLVVLGLLGEHKVQDWQDAAKDTQRIVQHRREKRADSLAVVRVNARVDSLARVVRALQRRAHMTAREIAQYQGPPEPPKRGGVTGFLSRFFGSGG